MSQWFTIVNSLDKKFSEYRFSHLNPNEEKNI